MFVLAHWAKHAVRDSTFNLRIFKLAFLQYPPIADLIIMYPFQMNLGHYFTMLLTAPAILLTRPFPSTSSTFSF